MVKMNRIKKGEARGPIVRTGPRGGDYIIVKGKKVYLSSRKEYF